jgi:hypothetical protein
MCRNTPFTRWGDNGTTDEDKDLAHRSEPGENEPADTVVLVPRQLT